MTEPAKHSVAMLLYKGVAASDVAGPLECFGLANYVTGRLFYDIHTFTSDGKPVAAAGEWLELKPNRAFASLPQTVDTLMIPGGPAALAAAKDGKLVAWLSDRGRRVERVCTICNGAFILAATGLANGASMATHWLYAEQLSRLHPTIAVDRDAIYVRSGRIWSSGGMTSGIDMALAIIEQDAGRIVALEVARQMVLHQRRSGGQSQYSMHLLAEFSDLPVVRRLQQHIVDNPAGDLQIATLARWSAMSQRSLMRLFKDQSGMTPGEFIADVRLRHACRLLEASEQELKEIAMNSGLGSENNMRKVFMARLKLTPAQYRARFRQADVAQATKTQAAPAYDDTWLHRTDVMEFQGR
ncbi:MAG: helix-turn-helix domain-containing protein [Hoeflea sp.]|nr:helix-turn-helix domain-containing protein [Hoeflea sp.]